MKVEFLSHFGRDIDKIQDASFKNKLASIIEQVEQAKAISEVPNIKKIVGGGTIGTVVNRPKKSFI